MPPPCSDPFKVPEGTTLSLMPPFNEKEANWGWGGYRQYNYSNKYKDTAAKAITVLIDEIPKTLRVTTVTGKMTYGNASKLPKVAEWHVYGNEQQGRFLTKFPEIEPTYYGVEIAEDVKNSIFSRQLGKKSYELKDHLGNVRVTFSDIKIPTDVASQPFTVDLLSRSEYYPFGMKIDALSWNETGARYGYNGTHEQELAINPQGNYLDFGDFGYDTRVARRFNLDPMFAAYPHLSGYATFGNNPITYADPTGWEPAEGPNGERPEGGGGGIVDGILGGLSRIGEGIVNAANAVGDFISGVFSNKTKGLAGGQPEMINDHGRDGYVTVEPIFFKIVPDFKGIYENATSEETREFISENGPSILINTGYTMQAVGVILAAPTDGASLTLTAWGSDLVLLGATWSALQLVDEQIIMMQSGNQSQEEADAEWNEFKNNPPNHPDYKPPKNWNGKKVKNPNGSGSGYPDKDGRVWMPANNKGNHGKHWDVQNPRGGWDNIYPIKK